MVNSSASVFAFSKIIISHTNSGIISNIKRNIRYFLLVLLAMAMSANPLVEAATESDYLKREQQRLTNKIKLMKGKTDQWTRQYRDLKKDLKNPDKLIFTTHYIRPWIPYVKFIDRKEMGRYVEDALLLIMADRVAKGEWDQFPDIRTFLRREKTEIMKSYERESSRMAREVNSSLEKLKRRIFHIKDATKHLERRRAQIRKKIIRLDDRKPYKSKPSYAQKKTMPRGTLKVPGWPWSLPEGDGYIYKVTCREYSTVTGVPKTPAIPIVYNLEQFRKKLTGDYCAPNARYKTYTTLRIEVIRKSTGKAEVYEGERGRSGKP